MSSTIHDPKHFNSVEYGINKMLTYKNSPFIPSTRLRKLAPELKDFSTLKEVLIFGVTRGIMDEIREISVLSVLLQYKDNYQGTLDTEIEKQKDILFSNCEEHQHLSPVSLFKAIQSLLYQIEIKYLIELSPLSETQSRAYSFLRQFKAELAEWIIENSNEYDSAKWSID